MPSILAATWNDGLFVIVGDTRRQELAGRSVKCMAPDQEGGAFAIVDGHSLCHRTCEGTWSTIATTHLDLACLMVVGTVTYLGTEGAGVLRVSPDGGMDPLSGFDATPGRDSWYAGSAVIDGKRVGPPLGIRSMTATSDGAVLLANVHVGGIPRSTDNGLTWQPTIGVDNDVHEVCGHPANPRTVIAAAATGLCVSHDGGATWTIEQEGLPASYCSAVAFLGEDILVASSTGHFAAQGAVYRRPIDGSGPLLPVGGLPRWLGGIVDTGCIATHETVVAIADRGGNLHVSADGGHTWLHRDDGPPMVSKVILI
ncbi:MAG: hypothetical protein ABJE47_07365 [bacterium]